MTRSKKDTICFVMPVLSLLLLTAGFGGLDFRFLILPTAILIIPLFISDGQPTFFASVCVALMALSAAVSLFVTKGDFVTGLHEAQKMIVLFLAVFVGANVSKHSIYTAISLSALVCALIGLCAMCGAFDGTEFVFFDGTLPRLQSLTKYANTTASFLGCGYICLVEMECKKKNGILPFFGAAVLTALWLTVSKAGIPIFLVIGTLFVFAKKEARNIFITQNLVCGIFALAILGAAKGRMLFVTAVLVIFSVFAGGHLARRIKKDLFPLWISLAVVGIVVSVAAVFIRPSLLSTLFSRFEYASDAMSLLDGSILGNGPGSWRVLQFGVQSTSYDVRYLHCSPLSFLVEYGVLFFGAFFVLMISAVVRAVKKGRYAIAAIIALVIVHSVFDFDLSFGLMLGVVGLVFGNAHVSHEKKIKTSVFVYVIAALAAVSALYMSSEYMMRASFEKACTELDAERAMEKGFLLEKLCPKDCTHQMNLAAISQGLGYDDEIIKARLEKAVALSPRDPSVFATYLKFSINEKNARQLCEQYISLAPKQEYTYMILKRYVNALGDEGKLSDAERSDILAFIENKRKDNGVIDRNMLLEEITRGK